VIPSSEKPAPEGKPTVSVRTGPTGRILVGVAAAEGLGYSAWVYQAQGMVSVQADCTMDAAVARMHERARLWGAHVEEVAQAVLNRTTAFGDS